MQVESDRDDQRRSAVHQRLAARDVGSGGVALPKPLLHLHEQSQEKPGRSHEGAKLQAGKELAEGGVEAGQVQAGHGQEPEAEGGEEEHPEVQQAQAAVVHPATTVYSLQEKEKVIGF